MPTPGGRRRVVVTGVGALTPLGNDAETFWTQLVAGRDGAGPITRFDSSPFEVHMACEVKEFDASRWLDRRSARRMDRFSQMVVAAARMAEQDSGIDIAAEPERVGAMVATGIGGIETLQGNYDTLRVRGPDRVNPFSIPMMLPNMGAASVSMELGTNGPLGSQCTACAASNMSIGDGIDAIRLDRADVMLCGGTEAAITPVAVGGFYAMRALSRRNEQTASRPFDATRDGFVMGEAAAILVLEDLGHAIDRGARIYAELAGYGVTSDAHHITDPEPTGGQQARAIRMALDDAGVVPADIDYVNAHGTATPIGDASETRVLKAALGEEKARSTPISSTKGATGHCLGASGAVEAIVSVFAAQRNVVPPTVHYEIPDPECDLDYVPNEARTVEVQYALSNSFGFGGHNACLVVRKFADG